MPANSKDKPLYEITIRIEVYKPDRQRPNDGLTIIETTDLPEFYYAPRRIKTPGQALAMGVDQAIRMGAPAKSVSHWGWPVEVGPNAMRQLRSHHPDGSLNTVWTVKCQAVTSLYYLGMK